jgi:hypothetical protein
VKAILDSKSYCFPLAKLLLGFYDYRFKHLTILKELNTSSAPKFHSCNNAYFNDQDDEFTNQVYPYLNPREHALRYVYMLQQKVNSILAEINFKIYENVILPKCST